MVERSSASSPSGRAGPAWRATGARSTSSPNELRASGRPVDRRADPGAARLPPRRSRCLRRSRSAGTCCRPALRRSACSCCCWSRRSIYGDLTGRFYTVRFLMPRRHTRNVTSAQPRPGAGARVILDRAPRRRPHRAAVVRRRQPPPAAPASPPARVARRPARHSLLDRDGGAGGGASCASSSDGLQRAHGRPVRARRRAAHLRRAADRRRDLATSSPGASDNASGVATRARGRPPASERRAARASRPGSCSRREGGLRARHARLAARARARTSTRATRSSSTSTRSGTARCTTSPPRASRSLFRNDARLVAPVRAARLAAPRLAPRHRRTSVPAMRGYPSITICCARRNGRIAELPPPDRHARRTSTPRPSSARPTSSRSSSGGSTRRWRPASPRPPSTEPASRARPDCVERLRVLGRGHVAGVLADRDRAHGAAQDLGRARLRQRVDEHDPRGLERPAQLAARPARAAPRRSRRPAVA